jgi:hypothetical protein
MLNRNPNAQLFCQSAVPILDKEAYIVSMDYSPLLAGFSIVLKDGRAGFLTSSNLKFDPNVSYLHNKPELVLLTFLFCFCSKSVASGHKDWKMRHALQSITSIDSSLLEEKSEFPKNELRQQVVLT